MHEQTKDLLQAARVCSKMDLQQTQISAYNKSVIVHVMYVVQCMAVEALN